jgi:2-C-methyl-D-erythritol 2,4-cyclodiphosphate synthase
MPDIRVGFGYDVHPFAEGRACVLGGVSIAHERGLLGHSDADVLAHAIGDALLGAAGLGDLGRHFPDTDERYRGVSSLHLLERIVVLLGEAGYGVANVDATVVAQRPRLAPFVPVMRERLGAALGIPAGRVSVKATTSEGLGFAGREEGIAAYAVALIRAEHEQEAG